MNNQKIKSFQFLIYPIVKKYIFSMNIIITYKQPGIF